MKILKILIALALCLSLCTALLACDGDGKNEDSEAQTETLTNAPNSYAENNGGNGGNGGGGSSISTVDDSHEKLADKALDEAEELFISSIINIDMTMDFQGTKVLQNAVSTVEQSYNSKDGTMLMYMDMALIQGNETVMDTYTSVVYADTDFFVDVLVSYGGDGVHQRIWIDATEEDLEEAGALMGTDENIENKQSTKDFSNVKLVKNSDGSYTYKCSGLKTSAKGSYEELALENIEGLGTVTSLDIDTDSVKYEVTVKNGKYVDSELLMTVDFVMDYEGTPINAVCEYVITNEYGYTVDEIKAPDDTYRYVKYTWDEYVAAFLDG